MKHSFLAVRAIATEFTHRIYTPVLITAIVVALIAVVLLVWLVSISAWWWLLAIPMFFIILVAGALLVLAKVVIKMVSPEMTVYQRTSVETFVDHLQELAEITQTPKAILLYRLVKDAVSPKKTAYIESVIANASGVKAEYTAIANSFLEQPPRSYDRVK
jgi:c-di-AMP phosphodiesterase-like protein